MRFRAFVHAFFYGNYFYGLCAVGLSVEAILQQRYPLLHWSYFVVAYALTVWYYTLPYVTNRTQLTGQPRTDWYIMHQRWVKTSQYLMGTLVVGCGIWLLFHYYRPESHIDMVQWLLLILVPIVSLLYYGFRSGFNIRRIGWLKPFVIGFSWAGLTTLYPVILYKIAHGQPGGLDIVGWLLFLKNLLFVTMLCIMFDIKDFATDARNQLRTIIVQTGLRKTIYYILIPVSIAGLLAFWAFGLWRHFSPMKLVLNTIPFLALFAVADALRQRRSLLFYLVVVDGLMLLKAVCGTIAITYF